MKDNQAITPSTDLHTLIESAQRLGIELDEAEALQWLTAMAAVQGDEGISLDQRTGVFGHKIVMLDFSTNDLEHFRRIGRLVEFEDVPGVIETALALSGSSAQSKIQTYPGDCDYFERVNILAESREKSCEILAKIMREKALSTLKGPTYQFIEAKFGNYPFDIVQDGRLQKAGGPISWSADDVQAGKIEGFLPDGSQASVTWEEASKDPGWCKLDWVIADPVRGQLANASNMLDVTWEAPDGSITPLDGYLDPYFQEVYLDAGSVPIFSKLAQHVSADALDNYVAQLEKEVRKYLTKDINYGKAAKRMYNIFRLTGRFEEAAFVRELFDEPATMLYQVWSLIRTIEDCVKPDTEITVNNMLAQTDQLIVSVVEVLEGGEEAEIVRLLLRLRNSLQHQEVGQELSTHVETARAEVMNVVNNFFYDKLTSLPTIVDYMTRVKDH